MRRHTPLIAAILLVCAVCAVVVLVFAGGKEHNPRSDSKPSATPTSTPTPAQTQPAQLSRTDSAELAGRVRDFLKAKYLLKPNPNGDAETRRRRAEVAPFVPRQNQEQYLEGLGLEVGTVTQADKARIKFHWTQRATDIKVNRPVLSTADHTVANVNATLKVTVTGPDHQRVAPVITTPVITQWRKEESGKWVLSTFQEGGVTED